MRRGDLDAAVPTCTGREVAMLVLHVGVVHRWVAEAVAHWSATERLDNRAAEREPDNDEPNAWPACGSAELVRALADTSEERSTWTVAGFGGPSSSFRRLARQTVGHRCDAEPVAGVRGSVDSLLAADGVDGYRTAQLGRTASRRSIEGPWRVLAPRAADLDVSWTPAVTRAVLALSAPASPADVDLAEAARELLIVIWNPAFPTNSDITGDHTLVDAWTAVVQR